MAESVRDTLKRSIGQVRGEPPEQDEPDEGDEEKGESEVGLAENVDDVAFQCGTCEYFDDGKCHNEHPDLKDREVEGAWCCNLYSREGMKIIV